ncbi:MAG: tol-pal system-associated acyl-CoA thioesterase [Ottowia sp.]|nr:tol-pal system-associated acyl-CoA thioesterase [Ottowia sp.]
MTTFELPIRVYWEDTDAGGIVFYANYLKFFERARTEWLRARGVSQQALRAQAGGMFVVAEAALRYVGSARLDDALLVTAELASAGRASLILNQQAFLAGAANNRGRLLCSGRIRIGWVDAVTLRPSRIPVEILKKIKS